MTFPRVFIFLLLVLLSLQVAIASDVLLRHKRQSGFCPSGMARGSSANDKSYLLLYSARDRKDVKISKPKELKKAGFNSDLPTVIYMHAFSQSSSSDWLKNARTRYSKMADSTGGNPNFNMLLFDWSAYSQQQYARAASYVPFLGDRLSDFLVELAGSRYNMSLVHLMSYSLSTHIAGQTGRKLQSKKGLKLGQITALDPTGVCFHDGSSVASKWALMPSDAELVVAKHYDMGGLGAKRSIGGVDVFVNAGKSQPTARSVQAGGYSSHARASAHESSLQNSKQCHEVAYACKNYASFLAGECASCGRENNKCYYMDTLGQYSYLARGIKTNPDPGSYKQGTRMYLKTSGGPNYCLHHHQVQLRLRNNSTSSVRKQVKSGNVSFKVGSSIELTPKHKASSTRYTSLLTSSGTTIIKSIATADSVKVKFEKRENLMDWIEQLELNYMSHPLNVERAKKSARFCPSPGKSRELIRC